MLNRHNKSLILLSLIFLFVFSFGYSGAAKAESDKVTAVISFQNLKYLTYYVSLLSKLDSQPNYSKESINVIADISDAEKETVQEMFSDYINNFSADNGYFGADTVVRLTDNQTLEWTYDLGDEFVILIYVVDEYDFAASAVLENYASTSYYKVTVLKEGDGLFVFTERNYSYFKEFATIIIKILSAIVLEIALGYAFKFLSAKHISTICATNFATQAALNILMFFAYFNFGATLFYYLAAILGGVFIFALEALIYCLVFTKLSQNSKAATVTKTIIYAFVANALSIGLLILADILLL
jgi:hypothetical protein